MRQEKMNTPDMVNFAVRRLALRSEWSEKEWISDVPFHCPYHADKTPSLYINFNKGLYHCFGCSRAGHISGLYHDLTGESLLKDTGQATDEFSRFAYVPHHEEVDHTKPEKTVKMTMRGRVIPADQAPPAIRYLRKRGIPFTVARAMQMAFMEHGWIDGNPEEMDNREKPPIEFTQRLLLPIYEDGVLLSVEGRDITGTSEKKVLYPRNTTVSTLYDLDKLDRKRTLYAVEGLMDLAVLRSDPYFEHSTAIFGASLSRRQIWLLNQFEDFVYIPDNDKAGRQTLAKLKDNLEKPFRVLDVPRLGDIKDIGDIPTKLRTTVEALRKRGWGKVLRNSTSIML
jgi:DNA primase